MNSNRLTKEELRHDAFVESTAKATAWLQGNFMTVLVTVVAVAVVAIGAIFFQQSRHRSQLQAGQLFFRATTLYTQGSYSEGLIHMDDLLSRFGGTREGKAALYLAGASHLALGENDRAVERFEAYLDAERQGFYAASARLGLGLAQEGRGELEAAVTAFEAARGALPVDDPRHVQAALAQARVLQNLGRIDAAIGVLEPLRGLEDFSLRQEVRTRLSALRALR